MHNNITEDNEMKTYTNVDELQCFIEQEHITEDSDRVFDINIWY